MAENDARTISLGRFLCRAVPWAVAAGFLWHYTHVYNAAFTVTVTKFLHWCVGYPAPYMFCDGTSLFWHSTMFPPIVGLGLASYWLRWRDRVLRIVAGYVGHCCLTAVAITINESPYLQQTEFRDMVTSPLVNADYLMFGIVIWLLTCGPWYEGRDGGTKELRHEGGSGDGERRGGYAWARMLTVIRDGWATRLVLLVVGVSVVVPVFAFTGSSAGREARARVADAMVAVPYFPHPSHEKLEVGAQKRVARERLATQAILEIEKAILADGVVHQPSAALYYLTGHLLLSLHPDDPVLAKQFRVQAALALREAEETRKR